MDICGFGNFEIFILRIGNEFIGVLSIILKLGFCDWKLIVRKYEVVVEINMWLIGI